MISTSTQIAVLGYGVTGQSVVRHLLQVGIRPLVLDTRNEPLHDESLLADVDYLWNVESWPVTDIRRAIVSPGLSMDSCLVRSALNHNVQLSSDIDLFFESISKPVIAITGTNGKSTVTSLVGHLLTCAGKNSGTGGNLGDAALSLIEPGRDYYVLELSSFQLERSAEHSYGKAVILNISADHLDMHGDMQSYLRSKQKIYAACKALVYSRHDHATEPLEKDLRQATRQSFGLDEPRGDRDWGIAQVKALRWFVRGDAPLCPVSEASIAGAHNELNVLAACALLDDILDFDQLRRGLSCFTGLRHRFEEVAMVEGVRFINDSKATNLGATYAALQGLPCSGNVILIAGGDAKGVDLEPLSEVLSGRVKSVVAIGRDAASIMKIAVRLKIDSEKTDSLSQAVKIAASQALDGDIVLLSPACASLDMFTNYADRGDQFVDAVRQLEQVS